VDFFLAAQSNKSMLHLFGWPKDVPLFRCALQEPLSCVAVSPDGVLCVGGGASGRVFLWDRCSGDLLRVWPAHYKAVSALAFSPCGSALASGGEDAIVHVWDTASLVDQASLCDPAGRPPLCHCTWTDHSLPITQLVFSACSPLVAAPQGFGGLHTPLVSASADRSVRFWDVPSRQCLLKLTYPSAVNAVAVHPSEQRAYAACSDGVVYESLLHVAAVAATAPGASVLSLAGANSGGGSAGVERGDAATLLARSPPSVFAGHRGALQSVLLTPDGACLVTASDDASVRIWDTRSRQQLASYTGHRGPVVAIALLPYKPRQVNFGASRAAAARSTGAADSAVAAAVASLDPTLLVGGPDGYPVVPSTLPFAPLKKHNIPPTLQWRGSVTGPVEDEVFVTLHASATEPAEAEAVNKAYGAAMSRLLASANSVLAASSGNAKPSTPATSSVGGSNSTSGLPQPGQSSDAADGQAEGENERLRREVEALQSRVRGLEDETARWKAVNTRLLDKLRGDAATK
jgi:pre-rRNA-processing protein IPI3